MKNKHNYKSFLNNTQKSGKTFNYLLLAVIAASIAAGTLFASGFFGTDTDNDGWTDSEEIIAGSNPFDPSDPWDSDGDGYLDADEFINSTDPLDPNDPAQALIKITYSKSVSLTNTNARSGNSWGDTGMPEWTTPVALGSFNPDGTGSVSYSFAASGGTKTGPGGSGEQTFTIPKGNIVSIEVRADDSATISVPAAEISASSNWSPAQKKIISGSAKSAFIDTSKITGETFNVIVSYTNNGGPYVFDFTVKSERVKAEISTVNISAANKRNLIQDNGAEFGGTDWDKNRERKANPISVVSGNSLTLIPAFNLFNTTPPIRVKAEFSIPTGTVTPQIKEYSNIPSGFEIPAPVKAKGIDYFDNNLSITWSVQYEGSDNWVLAGTSTHEIYFTRDVPATPLLQETVFWVSCTGGKGKTTEAEIVDGIWGKFSTGSGPANLCRKNGDRLYYWASEDASSEVNDFIRVGNGSCEAWARFFTETIKVQNLTARTFIFTAIEPSIDGIIIKNYSKNPLHASELPSPYTHIIDEVCQEISTPPVGYMKRQPGISGQNKENPPTLFNAHMLVATGELIYDPSYGISNEGLLGWSSEAVYGTVKKDFWENKKIGHEGL